MVPWMSLSKESLTAVLGAVVVEVAVCLRLGAYCRLRYFQVKQENYVAHHPDCVRMENTVHENSHKLCPNDHQARSNHELTGSRT